MKRFLKYFLLLTFIIPSCVMCSNDDLQEKIVIPSEVHKTFREIDDLIINPSQGWLSSSRYPSTVVYKRFQWADLEPEEGQYNWEIIDNEIAMLDKERGELLGFRIMTCNSHSAGKYTSPKWLFDKGCKGYSYMRGGNDPGAGEMIERIEPDYGDPLFVETHRDFIRALGARYNDNLNISFVDIGTFGNWGEWHLSTYTKVPYPSESVLKSFVDMYVEAFPDKRMVFMTDADEILPYALDKSSNIGLRRDGVGSPKLAQEWAGSDRYAAATGMGEVWKHAPVIFEWWGDYDYLRSQGWSFEEAVEWMLDNHVSLINDNIGNVPVEQQYLIDKLSKLAGARIVLKEVTHPRYLKKGETSLDITLKLSNIGVAKIYDNYIQRFYLYDSRGNIISFTDGVNDPNDWVTGEYEFVEQMKIPSDLAPGNYKIGYALENPDKHLPMFNLAIDLAPAKGSYIISDFKLQ